MLIFTFGRCSLCRKWRIRPYWDRSLGTRNHFASASCVLLVACVLIRNRDANL
jgi:hypothetical protein